MTGIIRCKTAHVYDQRINTTFWFRCQFDNIDIFSDKKDLQHKNSHVNI